MTIKRCSCGHRISQYAIRCADCTKTHFDDLHRIAAAIVAGGVCPDCGAPIRRNMSIAGWYQCSQYGAEGFRADSNRPACSWQAFTE